MSSIAKGVLRLTLKGQRFLPTVSILGQHQGKQHVLIVHPEPDHGRYSGRLDQQSIDSIFCISFCATLFTFII